MPLRRQAYASGIRLNAGLQAVRKQDATVFSQSKRTVTNGRNEICEQTSVVCVTQGYQTVRSALHRSAQHAVRPAKSHRRKHRIHHRDHHPPSHKVSNSSHLLPSCPEHVPKTPSMIMGGHRNARKRKAVPCQIMEKESARRSSDRAKTATDLPLHAPFLGDLPVVLPQAREEPADCSRRVRPGEVGPLVRLCATWFGGARLLRWRPGRPASEQVIQS